MTHYTDSPLPFICVSICFHSFIYRMIMTPGPKSRAGGIVSSGTLNKNSFSIST